MEGGYINDRSGGGRAMCAVVFFPQGLNETAHKFKEGYKRMRGEFRYLRL